MLRRIYSLTFLCLLPAIILRLLAKSLKQPAYRKHLAERFGYGLIATTNSLWLHAVSVGESKVALLILNYLRKSDQQTPIILTCTTASARELLHAHLAGDKNTYLYYAPFDLGFIIRRFIQKLQPQMLFIIETELWPNLLRMMSAKQIPVALINGRMSERSMKSYTRWPEFTAQILSSFTWLGVQYPADRQRFIRLGADPAKISVTGNIKIDAAITSTDTHLANQLKSALGKRPAWVAGSVRKGKEEKAVILAHRHLLATMAEALMILVPRHPERTPSIIAKIQAAQLKYSLFSQLFSQNASQIQATTQILIMDSIGVLPSCYQVADIAFVGGSIAKTGGQNILEPLQAGTPVITGPHLYNFATISAMLEAQHALLKLPEDSMERQAKLLAKLLKDLFAEPEQRKKLTKKGHDFIASHQGSLDQTMQQVYLLMNARR